MGCQVACDTADATQCVMCAVWVGAATFGMVCADPGVLSPATEAGHGCTVCAAHTWGRVLCVLCGLHQRLVSQSNCGPQLRLFACLAGAVLFACRHTYIYGCGIDLAPTARAARACGVVVLAVLKLPGVAVLQGRFGQVNGHCSCGLPSCGCCVRGGYCIPSIL